MQDTVANGAVAGGSRQPRALGERHRRADLTVVLQSAVGIGRLAREPRLEVICIRQGHRRRPELLTQRPWPTLTTTCAITLLMMASALVGSRRAEASPVTQADSAHDSLVRAARTSPVRSARASPQPRGVRGGWHLIFDQEFNGHRLSPRRWNLNWFGRSERRPSNGLGDYDLNCDAPSAATVSGGNLVLAVTHKTCRVRHGRTYPWTGALINTRRKFHFTYGFVQARIRVPTSRGQLINSLSFWADGIGTWPYTGELDILETLHCGGGRTAFAYHFHNELGAPGGCVFKRRPGGWHTFGANWQPGAVTYYYDGRRVGRLTRGITRAPMFLVLSQSVNPTHASGIIRPAKALVDYDRVWHRS
jgi:hypothetical protein